MNFPKIETLDDVLPSIEGRKDFIVVRKDGYTVVDYVYTLPDSFDDPIRLECRGLKFDMDGRIIARPLHKFFNVGEKQQMGDIDITQPHVITKKLDGSMVHSAFIGRQFTFMTRMGATDVAKAAEDRFAFDNYLRFCSECHSSNITPIFEYTAPDNRIVIRYEHPELRLIAMRETVSGKYLDIFKHGAVQYWKVPCVSKCSLFQRIENFPGFLDHTSALQGEEGYVVQFSDGHAVKIKADDYVRKHRAIDDLGSKKKVVAVILNGGADDILPMLDEDDKSELVNFYAALQNEINIRVYQVQNFLDVNQSCDRKTFATERIPCLLPESQWLKPIIYLGRDGRPVRECIVNFLLKYPERVEAKWRGQ